MAACNIEERAAAARRGLETTPIAFGNHESLPFGGVLLLLPFLLETGLLSFRHHYRELDPGYYYIDTIVLLTAFMYLCRIQNPEQLKKINPGDFGKLIGLDRIPEAKCLRKKIKEICSQDKSSEWNMELAKSWVGTEQTNFYYIDGHVQQYHGHAANLGRKYLSRQKLCLPGMQEFWVNNHQGMPYFYVTGQVNEKLQQMIEEQIVPTLLAEILTAEKSLEEPLLTIVFDREAYSPKFFGQLWKKHRVAVITYRKNVTDQWEEDDFTLHKITVEANQVEMKLAEKEVEFDHVKMREVRRLGTNNHQTSVLTTHPSLSISMVALYMFARWSQENFFRYMRQDYVFDKISQYAVEQIDDDFEVNNPAHSKLDYQIKKTREKIARRRAILYALKEESASTDLDKTPKQAKKLLETEQELEALRDQDEELVRQRKKIPRKIKVKDMGENRYNKLHTESKLFLNVIKMICYRAETSLANLLSRHLKKHINEKRALAKTIINTPCDMSVNRNENTLIIALHTLATPRDNHAVKKICQLINENNIVFPGTNLKVNYKSAT